MILIMLKYINFVKFRILVGILKYVFLILMMFGSEKFVDLFIFIMDKFFSF